MGHWVPLCFNRSLHCPIYNLPFPSSSNGNHFLQTSSVAFCDEYLNKVPMSHKYVMLVLHTWLEHSPRHKSLQTSMNAWQAGLVVHIISSQQVQSCPHYQTSVGREPVFNKQGLVIMLSFLFLNAPICVSEVESE